METDGHYWADINRYYGEITAGLPVIRQGNWLLSFDGREYVWPAQEQNTQASLPVVTGRFLGFSATVQALALSRRDESSAQETVRLIFFEPARQRIPKVSEGTNPLRLTGLNFFRRVYREETLNYQTGILSPTGEDYALLRSELRRGASFRPYDVGG